MSILDETAEDLNGRYTNAFFLCQYDGVEHLIYSQEFHNLGSARHPDISIVFAPVDKQDNAGVNFGAPKTLPLRGLEFKEWYPDKSLFNVDPRSAQQLQAYGCWRPQVLFYRSTTRQWHHGLSGRTTRLKGLFGAFINTYIRDPMKNVDFFTQPWFWWNALHPEYPTYSEALAQTTEQPGGVAMSKTLGLFPNPSGKGVLLHRLGKFIGHAHSNRIEVKDAIYAQEVKDFAQRTHIDVKVDLG